MMKIDRENYGLFRAVNELKSIISCAWHNGMLPQIRFVPGAEGYRPNARDWGVTPKISGLTRYPTSGITQPPIFADCALRVYSRATSEERASYLQDFLEISAAADRYHEWLLRERDPNGEGLVVCLHPWETGTDNSPAFSPLIEETRSYITQSDLSVDMFGRADTLHVDPTQRPTERDYFAYFGLIALFRQHNYRQSAIIRHTPFIIQDVLFNTLFAASLHANAHLEEMLAQQLAVTPAVRDALLHQASANKARAERTIEAIQSKLWHKDDRLFYSYDLRGNTLLRNATLSSLLPLISGAATREQATHLIAHLNNPNSFNTPTPIPSTPANSPHFSPARYWCGPAWPVTNWLIYRGLLDHNFSLAEELRASTLNLIAEGTDSRVAVKGAAWVMEQNSHGDELTTPSTAQYAHAWLWDSAIAAVGWTLVKERPKPPPSLPRVPSLSEYYNPFTGAPLGARAMTWTASLFLELTEGQSGSGSHDY